MFFFFLTSFFLSCIGLLYNKGHHGECIAVASGYATVIYTNVVVPVEAFLKAYSKYLLLDSNFYRNAKFTYIIYGSSAIADHGKTN